MVFIVFWLRRLFLSWGDFRRPHVPAAEISASGVSRYTVLKRFEMVKETGDETHYPRWLAVVEPGTLSIYHQRVAKHRRTPMHLRRRTRAHSLRCCHPADAIGFAAVLRWTGNLCERVRRLGTLTSFFVWGDLLQQRFCRLIDARLWF